MKTKDSTVHISDKALEQLKKYYQQQGCSLSAALSTCIADMVINHPTAFLYGRREKGTCESNFNRVRYHLREEIAREIQADVNLSYSVEWYLNSLL